MSRKWLFYSYLVIVTACADKNAVTPMLPGEADAGACEDHDHDGYGRNCAHGTDCDDSDARITTQCRTCNQPELGCSCAPGTQPISCFLPDTSLPSGEVMCREGTRSCRDGAWSGCEEVHAYVMTPNTVDTQRVVNPNGGQPICSICDVKCFQVVDNLLADGGVAGGNVAFAPGGGLTLLPGSGSGGKGGSGDAGSGTGLAGCMGLAACCSTLSGALQTACMSTVSGGNDATCTQQIDTYCPSGPDTGPITGCVIGNTADSDCDGIPDVVDVPGKPIPTTNNRTIFHQLAVGQSAQNSLELTFQLRNADVYFLMDMTNTMKEERDNLIASLTNGNVINCAQLSQCCNRLNDPTMQTACQNKLKSYTNQAGKADNQTGCLAAESTYCPGNIPLDCPDTDGDGLPDNALKEQGVVGAVRCLVGSSWFGAGYTRDVPIFSDPEGCTGAACGIQYGDRDEQVFRHIVDMTPDITRVRTALTSMVTNGNHDVPEGGMMALYSLLTGKGHYFGINRPAVPDRLNATGCPPNTFGYPCFRNSAIPIVVFFTDAPHHNGADDTTHCQGLGAGCPYNHLTGGASPGTWTSGANESSSDKQAQRVPPTAETFTTAFNVGDVRGQYYTLFGDTRFMSADYPAAVVGCAADPGAPDALIRFKVDPPAGATGTVPPLSVNFHLTKDDVYNASKYGAWSVGRTNDPSPATEFGSVISVFRGVPTAVSSVINEADQTAVAIASGPDSTYLTYTGVTNGAMSMPGYLGGISGCGADGNDNQVLFTFRPTANAHIVVDASQSSYPTTVSLHQGLPSALPSNPNTLNGNSASITNNNDTFATANAVPNSTTPIDGAYVERTGNTQVASIHADYTAVTQRVISGQRTQGDVTIGGVSSTAGLYVGMALSDTTSWSASPVRITDITGNTLTVSAFWNGASDASPVQIAFDDSLVGCGVDPQGLDAVFQFKVNTPRTVRIDTEGSSFDTVLSLHDAPPPTIATRTDVSGNSATPGYSIGTVTNASYTVSDVGAGTSALSNTYNYQQCGAAGASNDAAFTFNLTQPTHLGLDVSASSWSPVVALFSSQPGTSTTLNNAANTNDRIAPPTYDAFNVGDVYGQLDTRVTGSTLTGLADDYSAAAVGCGAISGGRDAVFQFTPSGATTVRVQANPTSGWLPVLAVFDDPPPVGGVVTSVPMFDATTMTLPDSTCLAYSFHDPAGAGAAHTYTVCPTKRYPDDANNHCTAAAMDSLANVNSAAEQAFLLTTSAATVTTSDYHLGGIDAAGNGSYAWRDTSALTYTNWASGQPTASAGKQRCVNMKSAGTWSSGGCTTGVTTDNEYYICEDASPAIAPSEDAATAYAVNPAGTVVTLTGNTRRMSSDYNGATLLGSCGGTITAGDAVFKIVTSSTTSFNLTVDSAGSSYNVVLGLFDGTIDSSGYKACAASGTMLNYGLLPSRTYYVLVKGTATSPEGSYKLKFADTSALSASGVQLACAAGTSTTPMASVDVDVDANHTYYAVVDQAAGSFGAYDLLVHALYRTRAVVDNAASGNDNGSDALLLPDPYRSRVTVIDTTTSGLSADYGAGMGAMCSASAGAPDAVYKFTPSLPTNVTFTVTPQGSGLTSAAVGVYDGLPGTAAVVTDLTVLGNPNEALASAQAVNVSGAAQQYLGNTSAMTADVDPNVLSCGAAPHAPDAVFSFHLDAPKNLQIDASASTVANPVINLFRASPLTSPARVTLQNDTPQQADAAPSPTPTVNGSWLNYGADMSQLTSATQTQVSMSATNSDATPLSLGDIAGTRVTIGGADTSAMAADYPGNWPCGANDAAPDALYEFFSSTNTTVHVKATPVSGFNSVVALYDGTNGPPLTLTDVSSVTENNACVPPAGPSNLTNATLVKLAPMLSGAPDVTLNCGTTVISTTDPDGTGAANASFVNFCGTQPPTLVQSQPNGPDLVVFLVKNFQISSGATLRVLGARPAVFVVTGNASINGTLTVSPDPVGYPEIVGAGGDVACGASLGGNAGGSSTNSGGGGGGGFGTAGGLGGFGSDSGAAPGGASGAARASASLTPLVGGCSGGHGTSGDNVGLAAGAVQISAVGSIVLAVGSGAIAADGGSGVSGASMQAGGSGGGSGGAILLQAPTVTYVANQLSAKGGLGGQGVGTMSTPGGAGSTMASMPGSAGQNSGSTAGGGAGGGGYGSVVLVTGSVSLAPCTMATNETGSTAWPINLDNSGRQYIEQGNTSAMQANYGGMCLTPNASPDAVYAFTLSKQATVQIDARASGSNTVLGLFNASSLGSSPTPVALENDTRQDADANPAPTPDVINDWLAYTGDLSDLSASSQTVVNVDNQANANEIIPTDLPDPIGLRVKVLNASTAAMSADYLAPSCSNASANTAPDALYRFVPSKSGQVRLSANYAATSFDPVIALYSGMHSVTDERVTLNGSNETALLHPGVDPSTVKLYDVTRTTQYAGPSSGSPAFTVIVRSASAPVTLARISMAIPSGATLSVDYQYDSGAPLPISSQVTNTVNLAALGNPNENAATATKVPVSTGQAYVYTGNTTSMTNDVDGSLFKCGPPNITSNDAMFDFSLDKATTVSVTSAGSAFAPAIAMFDHAFTRPSVTSLNSPAATRQQLYDVRAVPGSPESTCNPYPWNGHRYWLCTSARPWGQAEGMCQAVGLHLITIDNATENAALYSQIQSTGQPYQIGFTESVPYTNTWGVWTSGAVESAGTPVAGSYNDWDPAAPSGAGLCMDMLGLGTWNDTDCADGHGFVCEWPSATGTPAAPSGSTCAASFVYNGHTYMTCSDAQDWLTAKQRCWSVGMDLVRIDDAAENVRVASALAGNTAWLGGNYSTTNSQWQWSDGTPFWQVNAYRNWLAGEPNQPTQNIGTRMRVEDGTWVDTPANTTPAPYICEDPAPSALSMPPTASAAQAVNVFSPQRWFVGSTESVTSTVSGFIGCGASGAAPDAVFALQLNYATTLSVDLTGSFASAVVGVFKSAISSQGYSDAGSLCAANMGAGPQLTAPLQPGLYYVVLTGTTTTGAGYNIVFNAQTSDPAAFRMQNDTLADAMSNPLGAIDGQWLVKTGDMSQLAPTYGAQRVVDMGTGTNGNDVNPQLLDPVTGYSVQLANASTLGLNNDYPAGSCNATYAGPDALYEFTPTATSHVRARFAASGWTGQVVMYDGSTGAPLNNSQAPAAPIDLSPTYSNETVASARNATIGAAQSFLGNLSAMTANLSAAAFNQSYNNRSGASPDVCNSDTNGADAFFTFTIPPGGPKTVEVSSKSTSVAQTIALWDTSTPITAPAAVTAAYDTLAAANTVGTRLGSGDHIDNNWVVVKGDTTGMTPALGYTTFTEGSSYTHDDTTHALGNVMGHEFVTASATTSGLMGDYLASTLQCGGSSDSAADAIFSFSHSTGGTVRISLDNPNPAFIPSLALFKGAPTTAALINPQTTATGNTNEARATAYSVSSVGSPKLYTGNTASMANDYAGSTFTQGTAYGTDSCNPDAAGKDAFLTFTVPGVKGVDPPMTVELSSVSASFDHTIALWDSTPVTAPTAGTMSNDTRSAAYSNSIGAIDDTWVVESATMSSLMPDALTASAPSVANNNDVQSLGDPVGNRINVSGNTSTAGVIGDYTAATMTCGSSDSANDIIYKLHPSASTTVRIATNNPSNPAFSTALALFDGSAGGDPQKISDSGTSATTTYCSGFNYTPSNVTMSGISFAGAPAVSLTCAGPVVFDSSTATFTSGWCAGQTQPTPVVQAQGGGPGIVVLPFTSLSVGSTTTITLTSSNPALSRPVVFIVQGNATINGTINASASGTTLGAGSDWSCGSSTGTVGNNDFLNGQHGGGGGGAFRTAGGAGGWDVLISGGAGGSTRGIATLSPLLGGCDGGHGNGSTAAVGLGGGAIQISAGGSITGTGSIKADGGSAANSPAGGGGGGGSGGAVLLEGQSVAFTGTTSAKGGAGGKSSGNIAGGAGSTSSGSAGAAGSNGPLIGMGGGGGGGGFGWTYTRTVSCTPSIETFATAGVVPIGVTQTYTGPSTSMTSDLTGTSFKYAGACTPDTTGPDAFWKFTLTGTTPVQVTAQGSNYNHTLTLFNSAMTSLACNDGTSATGGVLTQTLGPGTYYVGIKSRNAGVGGTFNVAFNDTSVGAPYATIKSCTLANSLDAVLNANTDYYVVVKGASAGQAGTFNLTVTDIGAVTDFGCGTDLSAPDAYFDFTVSASNRNVTVALTEDATHLDGSFQLVQDGSPYNNSSGDTTYGACQTSAFTYANLPAGHYYVVVRGTSVVSGAGNKPALITIRDESGMNALDCANGSATSAGTITRTLQPGTYYAGITSRNSAAGGSYGLRLRDTSVAVGSNGTWLGCGNSNYTLDYTIPASDAGMLHYVVVKGATGTGAGTYTLTVTDVSNTPYVCSAADPIQMDPSAPDAYYAFNVADSSAHGRDVTVSLANSSALDGAYRLFHQNGTPVGNCHDKTAAYTYANLPADTYYLALRGKNAASGGATAAYQLSVQDQDAVGSIDCKDGSAVTGTTLTRTLNPGTYYVGIKPQVGQVSPENYRIQFRDTSIAQPAGATEITGACGSSAIDAAVTQNTPYYLLVKGATAADSGSYAMSVTDLSSSNAGFGCNDDPTAADAYFEFSVSDPNGRRVTVDTEQSALDTVIGLFPAGAPVTSTGLLACDDNSGATAGSSKITQDLPAGVYYAVVRAKAGSTNQSLPFQFSVRDETTLGSIACGATDASGPAQIVKQLSAGTYHVVVKGMPGNDKGAYQLRFRDEGPYTNAASEVACNDAQNQVVYNVTAGRPYYALVKGAAANQSGAYLLTVDNLAAAVGMGCNADPAAPDAVYRFHLSADANVQIDTVGSQTGATPPVPTDTVIAVYDVNASAFGTNYALDKLHNVVNCDDDSGDPSKGWSRITANLAGNRDYYVVVKSKNLGWGTNQKLPYTVNIRDIDSNQPIKCADANSSLLVTQTLPAGDYRLVVSNSSGASGGGPFDVRFRNMSVASNGGAQLTCAGLPDDLAYNITAGRPYYVMVKGNSASDRGAYGLVVESTGTGATGMGCGANPNAPDGFFKFNVAKQDNVVIDTNGSTADTVIAVYPANTSTFGTNYALDAYGTAIPCDDDSGSTAGASKIAATLAPGAYYLAVKGKTLPWGTGAQPFDVSIRDSDTTDSIACASASQGGGKIVQTLAAGDYNLVMSEGTTTGGAYSVTFTDTAQASLQTGMPIGCTVGGPLTVNNLVAGRSYYVVVKGNNSSDAGSYTLKLEDTVSLAAASGSTSIACAPAGSSIDGTYPAGTYYALVTGTGATSGGPYTVRARDLDALADQNRMACDDDSGPNHTSAIEQDLQPGTYYAVVKGKGAGLKGGYTLHVRDATAVPDHELDCAGADSGERFEYDVQAGTDYTVLLKGNASGGSGAYNLKLYDAYGLQNTNGQRLTCVSDAQPTTLYGSNWATKKVDFNLSLDPDTYYVSVKGMRASDLGAFQLQVGDPTARTTTTYTPPSWTQIHDALATSGVRVLPVISTLGDTDPAALPFDAAAASQGQALALTTNVVKPDGTAIWEQIQADGTGTGSGLITGIAQIADYLALDVSLVAVDGPDPGASLFQIDVAPVNSPSCIHPHPLVDPVTGVCTPSGTNSNYACNTQYSCAPGSAPKFVVSFTNPAMAPVPPNTNDPYGGYHFKLQIIGNKKYLLDEVPVYIIPTTNMVMGPPAGGSGQFQTSGTYAQDMVSTGCEITGGGTTTSMDTTDLPVWSDLYFNADIPDGASIDFELCAADTVAQLNSCVWSDGTSATRSKITVRSKGTCTDDTQCRAVPSYGNGFCTNGRCQFIDPPKIVYDVGCVDNSVCPNGPLGAGDFLIASHCETTIGATGYGHCVYDSEPADLGSTLPASEQGRANARVRVTLHSDTAQSVAPTLYQWNLTYYCHAAQ